MYCTIMHGEQVLNQNEIECCWFYFILVFNHGKWGGATARAFCFLKIISVINLNEFHSIRYFNAL